MMNPEAQAEYDRIVSIEPAALSEAEAGFLRARRDYLTEEQKAVYAEVLSEVPAAPGPEVAEAPAEEAPEAEDAPVGSARKSRR